MAKTLRKRFRAWFRDNLEWPLVTAILNLAAWLLRFMPYRMVYAIAWICGGITWLVPQLRRLAVANVQMAIPDVDARRVARQSMTHMCVTFLEIFWVYKRPERLKAAVSLDPTAERLSRHMNDPGCVYLSPHLGNWELGHQRLAQWGIPVNCVALKQRNPGVERLFSRARSSYGARIIYQKGAVKGIVAAINEKRVVEMLVDQHISTRKGGVFIPFFGVPALMSRAPAVLMRRSNIRIVIGYLRRNGDGTFTDRGCELPISSGDYESDEALLTAINEKMEELIRESPEQYLWMYRKWKTIPADAPDEVRARFPFYSQDEP
jgi:KDO2-lipid IV(A) lauroyltransferase